MNASRFVLLSSVVFSIVCLLGVTVSFAAGNQNQPEYYRYVPSGPAGFTVITNDPELPALLYLEAKFGIDDVQESQPLPNGELAKIVNADGRAVTITNHPGVTPKQLLPLQDTFALVADTCNDSLLESGYPYVIAGADLPYEVTFDTSLATNSGDYLGSAQDEISRPGGHDGFWLFTPDVTGTYAFTNSATKGDFTPVPDHDFERGFGGIGVWTGTCGEAFTEVGTANSLIGDSILPVYLEAGMTYFVVWEDYFVGSVENTVKLSIEYIGEPAGNSLTDAISLVDLDWDFEVVGDTTPNQNLEDSGCVEPKETEGHGTGGSLTGAEIWYRLPTVTVDASYTLNVLSESEDMPFVDSALVLHAYNLMTHQVAEIECSNDIGEEIRLSSIQFTAEKNLIYYVMIESVPAFDQPPFGTFVLQGKTQTSSVEAWEMY